MNGLKILPQNENPYQSARYLLAKGHTRIAYISPVHADAWSKSRCAGMRSVIAQAGGGYSLSECTLERSGKEGRTYSTMGREHTRAAIFEKQFAQWQARAPAVCRVDIEALRTAGLPWLFTTIGYRIALYSLLDKAAADRSITAWAMAFDLPAHMACQYCRERKIDVPESLAIVSFDDTEIARLMRITSYNYNFAGVASTILHYLLQSTSGFWSQRRVVEIAGKVVERVTG
jgi:DNA-binding LacI/PurR family transcriptional regulator